MIHAGADLLVRTVYCPDVWPVRVSVFDSKGFPKQDKPFEQQDIAGPCCFSGDLVARARELPIIEQTDIVLIHDCGAYTFGMFSHYNRLALLAQFFLFLQSLSTPSLCL